jgi:DNA-binding protein HU-beta
MELLDRYSTHNFFNNNYTCLWGITMNLTELKKTVAESTGQNQTDADNSVKAVFTAITEALGNGDSISIPGFGAFSIGERAARTGRNPQTGKALQIAASKVVKFKAGKALKETVNK